MIKLRGYQERMLQQTRNFFVRGARSVLLQSSTGSGKTVIASEMLSNALKKNLRCFFVCHRKELIMQTSKTLLNFGIGSEIISAGFPRNYNHNMQICSVQTLYRRKELIRSPSLILFDEAHFIKARTWKAVYDHYPEAYKVLLTATPIRSDGKGFGDVAQAMVKGPTTKELIEQGHLSDYKLYAPSSIDMTGVRRSMGDFHKADTEQRVNTSKITGSAIKEYFKTLNNKKALVFCVSINHSLAVVNEFKKAGVPAVHLDGETDSRVRAKMIEEFKDDKIKIISNVGLFSEGLDVPSLDGVIMLRPTQSLSLYMQQVGRALRPHEEKSHAIILDHVGNWERHGLPDDERAWSLEPPKKNKRKNDDTGQQIKVCEKCYAAQSSYNSICAYCSHPFPVTKREIEEVEGDLEEIDKKKAAQTRKIEQAKAKSYEDLVILGIKRGYKSPRQWAEHIIKARGKLETTRRSN